MSNLNNKRILLGVCGSIAAYKSADLVRRLKEAGADVRVIMTESATEFITPLTLQTLSQKQVYQHMSESEAESSMGHILLARWADIVLIAPASANFISKLAQGGSDDLLSTVCLATYGQIIICPAMNNAMWENHATQANIKTLGKRGVLCYGPASGDQACGETGPGRMQEPVQIINQLSEYFQNNALEGKTVLITAGPTQESIDPVRYISNRSSGKMGYALAQAAIEAGANVLLVSGPVTLDVPKYVNCIHVKTAQEMNQQVLEHTADADIFIAAAAVSDYRPETVGEEKIKKTQDEIDFKLVRNPDILVNVANSDKVPFTVGFAAETSELEKNALEKLNNKSLDMIAANDVSDQRAGFDSDENALLVLWQGGRIELPLADKYKIARELVAIVAERYNNRQGIKPAPKKSKRATKKTTVKKTTAKSD